jgi:DNA repair exonuclease SbcCD ATPase subunit
VTAAHVTWRPLGALLVEKGLLTAEELEDALAAQQTTGKRLGQILVDRGHLSGPTLTNALAEQYGIELKTEEGFGTGLRAEIERRHSTRRPPAAPKEAVADPPPEVSTEPETNGDGQGDVVLAELEPQLEEHWARLAAAEATVAAREARIAELETELEAVKVAADRDGEREPVEHALEHRAAELADWERELTEREQEVAGRQRAVLTAAADLEQRRKALEEREHPLAPGDAERPRSPEPERLQPDEGYGWNLDALTRLVEESADDFPDRVDDWRYTLFYLRSEARVDGSLPRRFDALVEECFGELVGTGAAVPALAR